MHTYIYLCVRHSEFTFGLQSSFLSSFILAVIFLVLIITLRILSSYPQISMLKELRVSHFRLIPYSAGNISELPYCCTFKPKAGPPYLETSQPLPIICLTSSSNLTRNRRLREVRGRVSGANTDVSSV